MSAWIVYSKDGLTERCELHAVEYGGAHMGERAVTATFESDSKVDFDIFDYLSYRGEVFELESVPTVKKTSSFEYSYELRFVSRKYELERCEMRDLVPSDNGVVYPTPLSFSFTGDVRYLTDRIQACLDDLYGEGVWNIVIADGVESEEKNITIAQQNCWNALALVNSTYGLDFYIKGRVITIGGSQPVVSHVFEYGIGNGLYEIERAANTDTAIVTKLRAYGSDRNLDYSYPKKPEWSDSNLPVSFAFSPLRLMLPSFKVDKTDYVLADEETIKKHGIREASIVYEDIYPSIAGATHEGQAIDEIKAVDVVDDNASTFVVYLHDLGFDLEEHLTTADAQISMKSGAMQGYTFTISNIEKQEDNSYKITLGRVSAEGGENYNIPNSDWNMREGDKFVLLNILMPQKYIREAENRLKQRAEEYLAQYSKTNFGYNIGLHDKFLIENPSIYDALIEGSKLSVYDEELGISEDVTIQSITITENAADNTLPQVKVTLNNEPSASTLDRIQGKIDSLANESAANNFATQSEIMAQYRKKLDKPFFDKLFAAVDAEGNEIPSTDTVTPVAYIKARYDFAVVGGVTMYLNDGSLDLPNIFEGLPIDNNTIYWDGDVLKSRGVGEGGATPTLLGDLTNVGAWANAIAAEDRIMVQKQNSSSWVALELSKIGGSADFSNVGSDGDGNAFTSFTLSEDGKSLTFVKGETFAKQSDYEALNTKVTDFLEGSDTDGIINKWKELEAFLSGMKESDDLATILATKWTKNDAKIANWDAAFGWGDHSKAGYMKKSVIYDESLGCWKLDGDLLVTGGITMFANEGKYIPSTITDAVNIDGNTLVRVNGVIMLNPDIEFGGGVADSVAWSNVTGKPTWIGNNKPSYTTSEVTEGTNLYFTNARAVTALGDTLKGYLPLTGGTITDDLRLRKGYEYTSPYLYFGNGDDVWLKEASDTNLTIHAKGSVALDTPITSIGGIEIKKSASGVLFIDANLVVSGGITMYGTDGTTANTIWDNAPIANTNGKKGVASYDPSFFAVENGVVKFIGEVGGSGVTDYNDLKNKPDLSVYALKASLSSYQEKITSTNKLAYSLISGTPTIPTNTNQLTNGSGYITSSSNITGNAKTATSLQSYTAVQFTKSDNGGKPCYLLISDVTSWYSASNAGESGIVGVMYGYRAGNMSGTCVQKMIAMCAYNKNTYELKTDVTSNVIPRIVKYNNKYYVALYMTGSGRSHYFIGKTSNMLSSFIELQCDAYGLYSGLTILYDTETMTMNGVSVPYATDSGNAATATKVTVTGTTTDGVFRVVLANSTDGNSQPNSLYMDNVTGAGYNPYSNTFVASAFNGSGLVYDNGTKKDLSSKGWYRIATSNAATNAGGTYMFSIKRSYNNTNNEAYIVAVVFDQIGCHFTQLAGHYGTQLITQIRCTYNFDGTAYFDIYYNGTVTNAVYVNGIGNMTVQTPTSTSSTLTNTDSFTLTNGAKSYTKEAYAITLCRKHSNGGTYIRYGAKDQLIKTWAVGPDSNHDFSWYWTDTSANIDSHRMRLDSYGNLTVEGNLLVKGGITMYADSSENPVETFYTKDIFIQGYGDGRYSRLSNGGSYLFYAPISGSWATGWSAFNASGTKLASACGAFGNGGVLDYLYYGGEYNTPWLKLKKTTLEGKYWLLNDTDTNPYLKFVHPYSSSTYTWYIQGYQGYLYLGSASAKSLRVSSDGSIYTPKTLTQGSDIRYKDVHKDLVLSLKEMSDAPSLEFHFMDDESKLTHIGTSAQYWQFVDGVVSEDNEGRLGMDYSSLGVVMGISLAKELSNYESLTDKEIRELKKRIGELEEEIENLKKV